MTSDLQTRLKAIVDATADAITQGAASATAVFRASATPRGTVGSTISFGRHTLQIDEPPQLGGEDSGPNPIEVYLASLIACQVVTYRFWAQRLGIQVDDLSVNAESDLDVRGFFGLDDTVRPGLRVVRLTVHVRGPETPARYAELQRAVDRHCPIQDLTLGSTPVVTTLVAS